MQTDAPQTHQSDNLSTAWLHLLNQVRGKHSAESRTLIIECGKDGPREDTSIRQTLDAKLRELELGSVNETADTIFPAFQWSLFSRQWKGDLTTVEAREAFYRHYLTRFMPKYLARRKATKCKSSMTETYFSRMINFHARPIADWTLMDSQIERSIAFINHYLYDVDHKSRPRVSGLSIPVFNPDRDHSQKNLYGQSLGGFPCLQQVSLAVGDRSESHGLTLHAFYPSESIFDRGYGNYLGFVHLGKFIGQATKLPLNRISIYIAHAMLGNAKPSDVTQFFNDKAPSKANA